MNRDILKNSLNDVCPKADAEYTKQEIVDMLKNLQKEMSTIVYGITEEKNKKPKLFISSLNDLIKKYKINEPWLLDRFTENVDNLMHTIACFINGINGESKARNAFKLLKNERNTEVLFNIGLEDDDLSTEYDAIVINEWGIFIVEVKNSGTDIIINKNGWLTKDDSKPYDIPYKIGIKETLLKSYLGDICENKCHSIMMFPNYRISINDEYQKIPICHGKAIVNSINKFKDTGKKLSIDEIAVIKQTIVSNNSNNNKLKCSVKCQEIIEDFIEILNLLEHKGCRIQLQKLSYNELNLEESIPESFNVSVDRCDKRQNSKNNLYRLIVAFLFSIIPLASSYFVKKIPISKQDAK